MAVVVATRIECSSSSSSPEDPRLSQPCSIRQRDRAPSRSDRSRSSSRHSHRHRVSSRSSHVLGGTSHSPWCSHVSLSWSPGACLVRDHSLGYRQPSAVIASSYIHDACRSSSSSVRALFVSPRPLLSLFPSMMLLPRYVSPSPMTSVMGPPLSQPP